MPVADRVNMAKTMIGCVVDHVVNLIALHENNAIVSYSDTLSRQIPKSVAANAFELTRESLLFFEFIRLSAIWDLASEDRESIPTVAALINNREVVRCLSIEAFNSRNVPARQADGEVEKDPAIAAISQRIQVQEAHRAFRKNVRSIQKILTDIDQMSKSEELKAIRGFRDKHLAHSLKPEAITVRGPKHGEQREILNRTIEITDSLYLAISQTGFAWDMAHENYRRTSTALWGSCRFEIKQ